VVRNCLDGVESTLSNVGILLVGKLLLQRSNGPAEQSVSILNFRIFRSSELLRPAVRHTTLRALKFAKRSILLETSDIRQMKSLYTYFVGASCSSIGPLMKVARLRVAALISSWALLMFSLAISSSRILTEFLFSFAIFAEAGCEDSATVAGIA